MEHLEYYILKLYEHKKNKSDIRLGINRFSPKKRGWAIGLLISLFVFLLLMIVLLFILPNDFWFLFGLIPCLIAMIILLIMDKRDRKINIVQHVDEYNKRINLLYNMLKEYFSIDNKEKLSIIISKFQKYLDLQNKEEQKMNKIIVTILTSLSGIITTSLANLNSIGIDFSKWLNIIILLLTFVCIASALIYGAFYFKKNLNSKIEKYESIINDLEYIQLCKFL